MATPEAARGLEAKDGEQLLLARDGDAYEQAKSAYLARLPDIGGPLMFASPDTPGMPAPSTKTAMSAVPLQ